MFFQGRAVGISLGCLLGMFPLLFFPSREEEIQRHKAEAEAKEKADALARQAEQAASESSSSTVPTSTQPVVNTTKSSQSGS